MASTPYPMLAWPENHDVKIWRYMDFTKFVDVLEHKALFFARADRLGDVFEGSYSRKNEAVRKDQFKEVPIATGQISTIVMEARAWAMISCWHMNDHESAAMWKLYSSSKDSIAIQSTFRRLHENLGEETHIGLVQYIDYETYWIPEDLTLAYYHKRKSFEHEREIRAFCWQPPVNSDGAIDRSAAPQTDGIWKSLDLHALIETVYVSHSAKSWYYDLVEKVAMRYRLEAPVEKSQLDRDPFY